MKAERGYKKRQINTINTENENIEEKKIINEVKTMDRRKVEVDMKDERWREGHRGQRRDL